jgi:hypothetical protein
VSHDHIAGKVEIGNRPVETGPLVRPPEYMAKVSSVLQRNISSGKRL